MKKNKNFSTLREAFNIAKSKTPRKKWNWIRLYGSRGITSDILEIIKNDELIIIGNKKRG